MKQAVGSGMNRTGLAMSPIDGQAMLENTEDLIVTMPSESTELSEAREEYATLAGSIGTMPPPSSVKEIITTAVEGIKGNKAIVLMDALGDRMAFERTGTRLYESLIAKVSALGSYEGGPTLQELQRVRDAELQHFAMLHGTVKELGGDPTLQTPLADVSGVLGLGLIQIVNDPRTTVPQALHAVHTAELVDNDGWVMLSELAQSMGHTHLASRFMAAEHEEAEHLAMVRRWMRAAQLSDASMSFEPVSP